MKKYFLGFFALVLAIGFSAFTKSVPKSPNSTIILEFKGNPLIQSSVADENLWQEVASHSCDQIRDDKACAVEVNTQDVTGTAPNRYLNVSRINFTGIPGAAGATDGYLPAKIGGSSTNTYTLINKD